LDEGLLVYLFVSTKLFSIAAYLNRQFAIDLSGLAVVIFMIGCKVNIIGETCLNLI